MSRPAEYRMFAKGMPDQEWFQALSSDARFVYMIVRMGLNSAGICTRYPESFTPQIAAQTGLSVAAVELALAELERMGHVRRSRNVVWIVTQLAEETLSPTNTSHKKSVWMSVSSLPEIQIVADFIDRYRAWFVDGTGAISATFAWSESLLKTSRRQGSAGAAPGRRRGGATHNITLRNSTQHNIPPKSGGLEADASAGGEGSSAQDNIPEPKPKAVNFPAEAAADHEELVGGVISPAKVGKMLKPLVDKHGWPAVRPAWREFCASEESRYTATWFVENYGRYGAAKTASRITDGYARKFIGFVAQNGFAQNLPIADHEKHIDEMAASGAIKDPERMKRELRLVEPWVTFRNLKSGEESRLVPLVKERLAAA